MRIGLGLLMAFQCVSCATMNTQIYRADAYNRIELVRVDIPGRAIQYLKDKKTNLCWFQDSGFGIELIDCKYFDKAK